MIGHLRDFKIREALPRMLADLAIVQMATILSLMSTFVYYIFFNQEQILSRSFFIETLRERYLDQFPILSTVFPLVFVLTGVYTRTRGYSTRYKWPKLFRGCAMASLLYIAASLLLTRDVLLPRSSLLALPLLVSAGVVGARWFNNLLEKTPYGGFFSPSRATQNASVPEAVVEDITVRPPVLVVGGAGYIGSIVVRKLLDRGLRVRLLDKLTYGDGAIADVLDHPQLEFLHGDCRNIQDVVRAMSGVRDVIHLAAVVGDPACAADDKNAFEINYAATRMMVEIAKGHGVERFLFASSCSVYGASDSVMDEQSATVPISLYAETKLNSEKVLLDAKSPAFHPVILRFATVFGLAPRPRFDLVVNLLTAKAFQEGVITIFNGDQWRPFIHVEDVAEAVCQALEAPLDRVSGEILNVGDDRLNYTLSQIADMIRVEFPNTRVENVENTDRRNYRVSFDKIQERIGFHGNRTIEEGIRELRLAFEQKRITNYQDPLYSNLSFVKKYGGFDSSQILDQHVMAAFSVSLANLASAPLQLEKEYHQQQRGTITPAPAREPAGA
jgi:nucleoside-diphosphate-sugar epimerase